MRIWFFKKYSRLPFIGKIFNVGKKNTPNNVPPIISTFWTKCVNYLYELHGTVKPEYASWLNEKGTGNTKYYPLNFLFLTYS